MLAKEKIKAAREKAGLTTEQAAELVGVTRRAWQLWEAGDRKMQKGMWELFNLKAPNQSA